MKTTSQKKLALSLLDWHGGQGSSLYAVGSCMLSDADKGVKYVPTNHRGHADDGESAGALQMAIVELKTLKTKANFPEAVTAKDERDCLALAQKLCAFI
jgi:hypothetical protein